ncbi:MAG: hypothetical protein KKC76_16065 [Proteobacteria bacterium]|jgi:hypothetical protein|nr:hypothetical protein [Pseudomonadota bacterium]MBU4296306.1 hypothetical protein [Pseudomonadota bacterium]MCG2746501.1 hypothetical protein [Desulfobulbaceae bacterium]
MKATAKTTATAQPHNQEAISQVGIDFIVILSALIGAWGVACLIGGISQYGIVGMITGWFSAVMGG